MRLFICRVVIVRPPTPSPTSSPFSFQSHYTPHPPHLQQLVVVQSLVLCEQVRRELRVLYPLVVVAVVIVRAAEGPVGVAEGRGRVELDAHPVLEDLELGEASVHPADGLEREEAGARPPVAEPLTHTHTLSLSLSHLLSQTTVPPTSTMNSPGTSLTLIVASLIRGSSPLLTLLV